MESSKTQSTTSSDHSLSDDDDLDGGTGCPVWYGVALVLCAVPLLTAYASPYWIVDTEQNINAGLWRYCEEGTCFSWSSPENPSSIPGYMLTVQVLLSVSLGFVACCGLITWCWLRMTSQRLISYIIISLTLLTGVLETAGTVVFGIEFTREARENSAHGKGRVVVPTGWSFWLAVTSAVLIITLTAATAYFVFFGERRVILLQKQRFSEKSKVSPQSTFARFGKTDTVRFGKTDTTRSSVNPVNNDDLLSAECTIKYFYKDVVSDAPLQRTQPRYDLFGPIP